MKKLFYTLILSLLISTPQLFAQRLVLVETFTNASCPNCGMFTPPLSNYVRNHLSQTVMIAYHVNFPHFDSLYFENPVDVNQRVSFYGIGAAPYSTVDGNTFIGSSATLLNSINSIIPNRALVAPGYSVSFASDNLTGNQLSLQIIFTSLSNNQSLNLKARVAVVEEPVYKADYNGASGNNVETEYPYAMRKMLPDAFGTTLVNKSLNGSDTLNLSWTANNFKNVNRMKVIAFVQNETTKEILQTAVDVPSGITGMNHISKNIDDLFSVYPSPAKDKIQIHLKQELTNLQIEIYDVLGKSVYKKLDDANPNDLVISLRQFKNGIYFIRVMSDNKEQTKKIIVHN